MEADFWYQKWSMGELGFHQSAVNPFLAAHLQQFDLQPGARVFVPLCGKSLDMVWLRDQGFEVVGIELVPMAVEQFFSELRVEPEVSRSGELMQFHGAGLTLFAGDFFALSAQQLGQVDMIYDRAALVALPAQVRERYAVHLMELSAAVPQLLVTFEYDQSRLDGPPFAVPEVEVQTLYGTQYRLQLLQRAAISDGPRGDIGAVEMAWQLIPDH